MGCTQSSTVALTAASEDGTPAILQLKGPGPELHRTILGYPQLNSNAKGGTTTVELSPQAPTAQTWAKVISLLHSNPSSALFVNPQTGETPLHCACRVMTAEAPAIDPIRALLRDAPQCAATMDKAGHLPLHYALIPPKEETSMASSASSSASAAAAEAAALNASAEMGIFVDDASSAWRDRAAVVAALISASVESSLEYLSRNDLIYEMRGERDQQAAAMGKPTRGSTPCTALHHVLTLIPDDFSTSPGPTVEFCRVVHNAIPPGISTTPNAGDSDMPFALLYRRFSRQFDLSEKFFEGDNSRLEVVSYRQRYKASAMNTWRIIQLLLRPGGNCGISSNGANDGPDPNASFEFKMVHAAVRQYTPPDLVRYILETKAHQVSESEPGTGRLPLHVAAITSEIFPKYHSKFVIDELLYSNSDAVTCRDGDGKLPLTLAIESGKTWIGGGVKSLVDAYPDALEEVELSQFPALREAMSFSSQQQEQQQERSDERESDNSKEEHHDAIMLVQKDDATLADVVSAMWSNEEDGGLQLLGCLAITRRVRDQNRKEHTVNIALAALTAVVNAMKNSPNEPAVQEKGCEALLALSEADGTKEISFAASGALSAIIAAMQAHVSDMHVQKTACSALYNIMRVGGADRATVIASVSGFTAIQNSLGAHPENPDVQREAVKAIEMLTSYKDANLPDLPGLQAAPLIQLAAEKFPEECKEAADSVLQRISNSTE